MPALSLAPTTLEDSMPPEMERSDVGERIFVMRIQEETTYRVRDYLAESVQIRKLASKPVDEDCRVKMCEWCYQVVDFCKFRRETVGIGMSYLDRFLCTKQGLEALCNRKQYQLAAMTALYIAIKLHEPLEMETSLLADLSRGCYTEMEFVGMEQTILSALDFRVNGPTPLGFVQYLMALLPETLHPSVGAMIMDYARYQTELAVSEQSFVDIRPSEIAVAAVLNAMEGMDPALLSPKIQEKFVRRIERYSEIYSSEVERTQSKLSFLLYGTISGDYEQIMGSIEQAMQEEYAEETFKQGVLHRRHSPKSVIR
jgi:Cyclin, N-terminal domain/Cyclin, C-terminal domain